jgi:hypothetical protein
MPSNSSLLRMSALGLGRVKTILEYLRERNATVLEFPRIEEMYNVLLDKKVDVLIMGALVLRYYATHEGKG